MGRCTPLAALAFFLVLPTLARADVPGGPPAEPPDCPPGTTLEGPYRYWRCVPVAPADPAAGADDPAPPPEPPPPVEAQATPPAPAPAEGWHTTTASCAVAPRSSGGGAGWMLLALIGVAARRRAR